MSIGALARLIAEIVGFDGNLVFDASRPDGTMRKLVDTARLQALGWQSPRPLRDGVKETYSWFVDNIAKARVGSTEEQLSGKLKPSGTG